MAEAHSTSSNLIVLLIKLVPYHYSRLQALHKQLSTMNINLHVIELTRHHLDHPFHQTDIMTAFSRTSILDEQNPNHQNVKVVREVYQLLNRISPEYVVIAGYAYPAMRAAARWCWRRGRMRILLSESHRLDRKRFFLKECLKGWWIRRHFDAAFVGGSQQAAYLKVLGFPSDRIWTGYDVVDNQVFSDGATSARADDRVFREKLGLPDHYFLYVGRFSPEKNLIRLLKAYVFYRRTFGDQAWKLVMVGSGPQEAELKREASALGLKNIIWPGFQQIDVLPVYYGLASCFILSSTREPWGLVVNEAMASGLPVLVSTRCGCVPELVRPGLNGYVFDPETVNELADLMIRMTKRQTDLEMMGEESRRIIQSYSPETWAKTLADCIEVTMTRKGMDGS